MDPAFSQCNTPLQSFCSVTQQQAVLRIKITIPDTDRPEFYVPARPINVDPMFAVIPALADRPGSGSEDRPSYVKIVPREQGDSVNIKVSVLFGKLDKSGSADRLKSLKEKPIGEFLVANGDKVSVLELKRFGIKPVDIEVVQGPCVSPQS